MVRGSFNSEQARGKGLNSNNFHIQFCETNNWHVTTALASFQVRLGSLLLTFCSFSDNNHRDSGTTLGVYAVVMPANY